MLINCIGTKKIIPLWRKKTKYVKQLKIIKYEEFKKFRLNKE